LFGIVRCGPARRRGLVLVLLLVGIGPSGSAGSEPARRPSTLALAGRAGSQDPGAGGGGYRLRDAGATGLVVAPGEVAGGVEGWVSNSRVASHAVPRHSAPAIARGPELTAVALVIAAPDEEHRCREKLVCQVSTDRVASKPQKADNGQRARPLSLE